MSRVKISVLLKQLLKKSDFCFKNIVFLYSEPFPPCNIYIYARKDL